MPDGIATYHINGVDYIVTANEGDSREWGEYLNEDERNFGKGETSPTGKITAENSGLTGKVVFLTAVITMGLTVSLTISLEGALLRYLKQMSKV